MEGDRGKKAMERDDKVAQRVYRDLVDQLEKVFTAVRRERPFEVANMLPLVRRTIRLLKRGNALLPLVIQEHYELGGLATHSVNVAIIALKLGMKLGYEKEELAALGVTALLHDVGMALIPRSVWDKRGSLSRHGRNLLRRHPEEGTAVLEEMAEPEFSWLPGIVAQEHERMDGSGYPLGLRGDEVHEMAYIIGLADSFEAMTHFRAYREGLTSFSALQELSRQQDNQFPVPIMSALVRAILVDFSMD